MIDTQTLYASVDLELTGFDPAVDEVVEIGIVQFQLVEGKLVILKEWQSLIRPNTHFHTRIQGLTGITEADLESAPSKEQVLPEIQELLREAIVVGHGVSLDKRFLETFGVVGQPEVIDTLELAQIFLPTYHSYNLENLSHTLSVHHGSAHRALSDAQATLGVLRALVGIFWSLPESTRVRVLQIAQKRKYPWANFFMNAYAERFLDAAQAGASEFGQVGISDEPLPRLTTTASVLSVSQAFEIPWKALTQDQESWVVALSSREQVLEAGRKGYATPYLGIAEAVSPEAIEQAELSVDTLHEREVLALLKILVWHAGKTEELPLLAEINWSLLGTDFKKRFSAVRPFPQGSGVVAVDYRSIAGIPAGKSIWICETDKYIDWLELQSGQTLSWQGIIHQFRQIYNPENGFGDEQKAPALQDAVVITDLFYASVLLLLKKHHALTHGVIAQADLTPFVERQLVQAGRNYAQRLRRLSILMNDKNFMRVVQGIETFFEAETPPDELRWLEIADGRCVFISRPLNLAATQQALFRGVNKLVYTTDVQGAQCIEYLRQRVAVGAAPTLLQTGVTHHSLVSPSVSVYLDDVHRDRALLEFMTGDVVYVVFPNQRLLKAYYDSHYVNFVHKQAVIAVGVHGGVNKVLRNFGFSAKTSVLIAHSALAGFSALKLDAHRLVYVGLPVIDLEHPFVAALVRKFFSSVEQADLVLKAVSLAQSLRPFGVAAESPEIVLAVLSDEALVCERMLAVLQE